MHDIIDQTPEFLMIIYQKKMVSNHHTPTNLFEIVIMPPFRQTMLRKDLSYCFLLAEDPLNNVILVD